MQFMRQVLAFFLSLALLAAASPVDVAAQQGGEDSQQANLTPQEIDNLVAPIALYPDALVAQILAGATYPDQIVEADKLVKANSKLSANDLMQKADQQPWDPSVKALTQFPSVLDNMTQNLNWTSALGDAAYYQQADCMAAVQRLRKQAKAAGNLKTTSQMTVVQQDPQTIIIQPANPQVVYVPTYNPTVVYGTPYSPPGYSTAALVTTGLISFGLGMAIGASMNNSCCGWGWNSWGCGWHGGSVTYNRNVYVSRSNVYAPSGGYRRPGYGGARPTPYGGNNVRAGNRNTNISGNTVNINNGGNTNVSNRNRNNVNSGNKAANLNRPAGDQGGNLGQNRTRDTSAGNRPNSAGRPAAGNRGGAGASARPAASPSARPASADRGYGKQPAPGTKSGAFSGYSAGGNTRAQSDRGRTSMNGGGGGRQAPAAKAGGGGNRKR